MFDCQSTTAKMAKNNKIFLSKLVSRSYVKQPVVQHIVVAVIPARVIWTGTSHNKYKHITLHSWCDEK